MGAGSRILASLPQLLYCGVAGVRRRYNVADEFDQLKRALAARYAVDRELGRGGMASRAVAIKVLSSELSAELGAERFLREIAVTARLEHAHILPLLDSGDAGGLLYYVMPFGPDEGRTTYTGRTLGHAEGGV